MTTLDFYAGLNYKMKDNRFSQFVKPYSRGQITIPQEMREYLGITSDDWLFLTIEKNSLVIRPVKREEFLSEKASVVKAKVSFNDYLKVFSKAKGVFGPELERENNQVREEVGKRLRRAEF